MSSVRLAALNAARWFAANATTWILLSGIYSLTVSILLQTVVEQLQKKTISLFPVWILSMVLLLAPGALEKLPMPDLPSRWVGRKLFSEKFWSRLGGSSFLPLYLRHELRRTQTWVTLILTVTLGALLPQGREQAWIFIAQIPLQRALWSIGGWRRIALRTPDGTSLGGTLLLNAFLWSQLIQAFVAIASLAALHWFQNQALPASFVATSAATVSAVLGCSAVCMEGDAGRPWLVNFIGFSAGIIAAALVLWQPPLVILSAYVFSNLKHSVQNRLWAVEEFDEDALLS
jgi:hypothetical protein